MGNVEVHPDELGICAKHFANLANNFQHVHSYFESTILSPPLWGSWGDDEMGKQFYEGSGDPEKSYKAAEDGMNESIGGLTKIFDLLAKNLRDTAAAFKEVENINIPGVSTPNVPKSPVGGKRH